MVATRYAAQVFKKMNKHVKANRLDRQAVSTAEVELSYSAMPGNYFHWLAAAVLLSASIKLRHPPSKDR